MTSLSAYLAAHPDNQNGRASSSRMHALYADISRHKQSDPASYRANVEWWRKLLVETLERGLHRDDEGNNDGKGKAAAAPDRLVLHVNEQLKERLTLDHVGRPLGLGAVVLDLAQSSQLTRTTDFLSSEKPLAAPSKAQARRSSAAAVSSFAMGSLSWALSQIGIGGSEDDDEDGASMREWRQAQGDWVCWEALSQAADTVVHEHYSKQALLSPLDSLYTRDEFAQKLGGAVAAKWGVDGAAAALSSRDVDVLLKHLERDLRTVAVAKDTVKFARHKGDSALPVTQQDRDVLSLRTTHARLEGQISDIQARITETTEKIKAALRSKREEQAKSYLRSRKALEELLNKRTGAAETLGGVLIKIEQAAGDAEIVAAYDLSASTLKSILSDPSLQVDKVEATMERLSDAVADQREIEDAIHGAAPSAAGEIDEDEIAKELAALEAEAKEGAEPVFPSVPTAEVEHKAAQALADKKEGSDTGKKKAADAGKEKQPWSEPILDAF